MSTLFAPASNTDKTFGRDRSRIVLEGVSWATFLRLLDETGDRRRIRLAFNRGVLELMSPGPIHEEDSRGFDRMIAVVCSEAGLRHKTYGSTTWKSDGAEKGIEADECYYFSAEKINKARDLRRRRINDSSLYPRPDLAIEIDIRRSSLDRHEIYAALEIPELWSFADESLHVERLGDDGLYTEVSASGFIPLRPEDLSRWIMARDVSEDDTEWEQEFRAWVRETLGPGR